MESEDVVGLRLWVSSGGCSGWKYEMALAGAAQILPDDQVIDLGSVKLVVDPVSLPLLQGSEIDYLTGLMQSGFTVHNPNAVSTCGCGHSFNSEPEPTERQDCGACSR